jgi:hypothetical protein
MIIKESSLLHSKTVVYVQARAQAAGRMAYLKYCRLRG